MEEDNKQSASSSARKEAGRKPSRNPKQGNTELFNELLSAANALSVNERTRLVKSLAGQLSLVVIGSGELLQKEPKASKVSTAKGGQIDQPRANPLKGTKFDLDKEAAYKALVQAKNEAGGAKLSPEHPAVVAYGAALAAYKQAHSTLKPIGVQKNTNNTTSKASGKQKARTTADRSPEPPAQAQASLIGRISQIVKNSTTSSKKGKSSSSKDMDEEML